MGETLNTTINIKQKAIEEAHNRRREQSEEEFQSNVEDLVYAIEEKSDELRRLKKQLADLQYKAPNATVSTSIA
jgi:seryl-tRNA synthetase